MGIYDRTGMAEYTTELFPILGTVSCPQSELLQTAFVRSLVSLFPSFGVLCCFVHMEIVFFFKKKAFENLIIDLSIQKTGNLRIPPTLPGVR